MLEKPYDWWNVSIGSFHLLEHKMPTPPPTIGNIHNGIYVVVLILKQLQKPAFC